MRTPNVVAWLNSIEAMAEAVKGISDIINIYKLLVYVLNISGN